MIFSAFVDFIQELIANRHPLAVVVLLPIAVIVIRMTRAVFSFLSRHLLLATSAYSPGFFVPQVVKGTVYPYGIVELRGAFM